MSERDPEIALDAIEENTPCRGDCPACMEEAWEEEDRMDDLHEPDAPGDDLEQRRQIEHENTVALLTPSALLADDNSSCYDWARYWFSIMPHATANYVGDHLFYLTMGLMEELAEFQSQFVDLSPRFTISAQREAVDIAWYAHALMVHYGRPGDAEDLAIAATVDIPIRGYDPARKLLEICPSQLARSTKRVLREHSSTAGLVIYNNEHVRDITYIAKHAVFAATRYALDHAGPESSLLTNPFKDNMDKLRERLSDMTDWGKDNDNV